MVYRQTPGKRYSCPATLTLTLARQPRTDDVEGALQPEDGQIEQEVEIRDASTPRVSETLWLSMWGRRITRVCG